MVNCSGAKGNGSLVNVTVAVIAQVVLVGVMVVLVFFGAWSEAGRNMQTEGVDLQDEKCTGAVPRVFCVRRK